MRAVCFWWRMQHMPPKWISRLPKFPNWPMDRWKRLDVTHSLQPKQRSTGHRHRNVVPFAQQRNLLRRTNGWCGHRDGLSLFLLSNWPDGWRKIGRKYELMTSTTYLWLEFTFMRWTFSYLEFIGTDAGNRRQFAIDFSKQRSRLRCFVRAFQCKFRNECNLTDNGCVLCGERWRLHSWISAS